MADHKAKMVFAHDVWEKIKYFTYNFPTEIGALGNAKLKKGADGEKYFYIDKLFFPKQKVTGATVHFTADMWGDLLVEHGLKGLKDIAFYWHRHPGNSAHSGTDDIDTFETFMSKEAGRKHFLFLQTAVSGGVWNDEARIDLRLPVRTTIMDAQIDIRVEQSPENLALAKECTAIAEKVIVKEPVTKHVPATTKYGGYWKNNKQTSLKTIGYEQFAKGIPLPKPYKTLDEAIKDEYFGVISIDSYDNDIMDGYITMIDEKLSIVFKNGAVDILAGKKYSDLIDKVLSGQVEAKLSEYVRSFKKIVTGDKNKYLLQPKKKQYMNMKASLIKSYLTFCSSVLAALDSDDYLNEKSPVYNINEESGESFKEALKDVVGLENVQYLINEMQSNCIFDWNDDVAIVYDLTYEALLGTVTLEKEGAVMIANGLELVQLINDIEDRAITIPSEEEEIEDEEEE